MKNVFVALLMMCGLAGIAQNFEGEIVYSNSYKSKSAKFTDEQLTATMGTKQNYFIKGAQYKAVLNGKAMQWQLYSSKENRLYSKMASYEMVYWTDVSKNNDVIYSSELHKEVTTILGYKCDELVLTCKSGTQKYYFNSKLGIDAKLFVNYKYGNWYDYLRKAGAVPLKIIIDTPQFTMESVATQIKPGKLEDKFFILAPGTKTDKSPF